MSISLDSLRERVPAIFTKTPSPKVSDRYSFADSEYYLQKFIDADWTIHSARQLETLMQLGNAVDFTEIERGKWEGYTRSEKYWLNMIPGVKGFMQGQDTQSSNQFLKNKQLMWLY